MVAVVVNYDLAPSFTTQRVRDYFNQAIPKFMNLPGLIRKYFLVSEDGHSAGSVYLWEDREKALAFHDEAWKDFMANKYGYRPTITVFDCPYVVDNAYDEVVESYP